MRAKVFTSTSALDPARIGGGGRDRDRARPVAADEHGLGRARRVEHGDEIVGRPLDVGRPVVGERVGQPRPSPVEQDDPAERGEPLEEAGRRLQIPDRFHVAEPSRHHQHVTRAAGRRPGRQRGHRRRGRNGCRAASRPAVCRAGDVAATTTRRAALRAAVASRSRTRSASWYGLPPPDCGDGPVTRRGGGRGTRIASGVGRPGARRGCGDRVRRRPRRRAPGLREDAPQPAGWVLHDGSGQPRMARGGGRGGRALGAGRLRRPDRVPRPGMARRRPSRSGRGRRPRPAARRAASCRRALLRAGRPPHNRQPPAAQ